MLQSDAVSNAEITFGSADGAGDIFEIEACATIYMPATAIQAAGYTALSSSDPNGLCMGINTQMQMLDIVDILGAQAGVKTCFNTCSGDGAGAGGKPELDNNSDAAAMSGNSASAFLSNGAPNPGLFKKEFACFDLCAEFNGSAFQLNGGNGDHKVFEDILSDQLGDYVDGLEKNIEEAVIDAVNARLKSSGQLSAGDVAVTMVQAEHDLIHSDSGSGFDQTIDTAGDDVVPDVTAEVPDVTSNDTDDSVTESTSFPGSDVIGMTVGFSMHFPALWLINTMFSDIEDFCEVFSEMTCADINSDAVGGSCWIESCDQQCYANGDASDDDATVFTGSFDDSVNSEVAAIWGDSLNNQSNGLFAADNGNIITTDPSAKSKYACFSAVMTVHLDSGAAGAVQAVREAVIFPEVDATLTDTILREYMVHEAKKSMRDTVLAGPLNWEESPVAHRIAHGGYICESSPDNDKVCLLQDTKDAGFISGAQGLTQATQIARFNEDTKAGLSGINCNAYNGGCSHICDGPGLDGECKCPNECWELQSDKKLCKIGETRYALVCHSDRMEAHLAKCVVSGMSQFRLGASDCTEDTTVEGLAANMLEYDDHNTRPAITSHDSCSSSSGVVGTSWESGCLRFITKLDECSMDVHADYQKNELLFIQELITTDYNAMFQSFASNTNSLSETSQSEAMINVDPRVSVDFTCKYTADYTTEQASVATSPDNVTKHLMSQGMFAYSLKTLKFENNNLESDPSPTTIHSTSGEAGDAYNVGETLYFAICDNQNLNNVYFSVPECTVSSGTEQYQIITDYCPDKFVNTNFEGRKYNGFTQYWKEGDWGEGSNWDDDALVPLPVDSTGVIATLNQPTLENSNPGKTNLATNECLYFSYTVFEFVTNASDQNDLRLTCKVKACEYSSDDPLAMGACIDDSVCSPGRRGRKRRSVGDSERYTTISQRIRVVNPES